jgi:hypothetical protein
MAENNYWPPEFDFQLIGVALPDKVSLGKRTILPSLIEDWAEHDLRSHSVEVAKSIAGQKEHFKTIAKLAHDNRSVLERLDEHGRFALARRVGVMREHSLLGGPDADEHFNTVYAFLLELETAASTVSIPRSGKEARPEFEIIQDIGEIYTWVTGDRPARALYKGDETGPFRRFVEPIWQAIFTDEESLTRLTTAIRKLVNKLNQPAPQEPPRRHFEPPRACSSLISEGDADAHAASLGLTPWNVYYALPPRVIRWVAQRHPLWKIEEL